MVYVISADVKINNTMVVEADSENEARAKASATLFTVLDDVPMFPEEVIVLDTEVESVKVKDSSEHNELCNDFFPHEEDDEDYDPPEYFSD